MVYEKFNENLEEKTYIICGTKAECLDKSKQIRRLISEHRFDGQQVVAKNGDWLRLEILEDFS